MIKPLLVISLVSLSSIALSAEHPLCQLPYKNESGVECSALLNNAKTLDKTISLVNNTLLPKDISVGAVYLQAITMAPAKMMREAKDSDIHLELDLHAKNNIKSSGFTPGDWLPNAKVSYTITKLGEKEQLVACGYDRLAHKATKDTTCTLMAMVASDGAHYGDNVRLDKPGIYVVDFNVNSTPETFGWHVDTDSKILSLSYVQYNFEQKYIFAYTGVGKKGGY